jgi:ATP-dependent RNA helicase RhlE
MYKQKHTSHRRGNSNQKRTIRTFDPRTIIGKTEVAKSVVVVQEIKNQFSDFKLNSQIHKNIVDRGYSTPTPIQDQSIPKILEGLDVVGTANTGTGKTAAFLLPLLNKVYANKKSRVLIIAPTRELAIQIDTELKSFSPGLNIHSAICIGGVSIGGQINQLQRNPNFVIGTPGRLLDLENQRKINFNTFDSIVLDEVDRMLDMGFIHDMTKIISKFPKERQSLFFSATLDDKVKEVMKKFVTNPVIISVKTTETCDNVRQEVIEIKGGNKLDVLRQVLEKEEVSKSLVFMRTKHSANKLHKKLTHLGYRTAVLHGNKSQNYRQRSLKEFTTGKVNILIATDVASRGIDVDDISHVINYDMPDCYEVYIHRIGRTGRADKKGVAITFVN